MQIKNNLVEKIKAVLAEEIRWYRFEKEYEMKLEGENKISHIKAARKKQKLAREKFRKLIGEKNGLNSKRSIQTS
ncbi:MAG: hypothetical protein QXU40_01460 [Candidatus Pacearchaeota archaeon]